MSQAIIQEIINDIIAIDPELQSIKSELEKLVQELIANKPQTPFTKEFKDSLKAQIIGAINEQRIVHEEENKWDRSGMFHSLKFWMIGFSTVTAGFLIFTIFHYIENIQQPTTQITYIDNNSMPVTLESESNKNKEESIQEKTITNQGGGASNSADNVMMLAIPETNLEPEMRSFSINDEPIIENEPIAEYTMMKATKIEENTEITFCETSREFILANNITEDTTKTFTYDNQIYKATINFTNNSITINNIGTQNEIKIQTELPDLNLFFEKNNFNIKSDYLSPIIEDTENTIEYYFPKYNNQEGITVRIDKNSNIIFSIQNICIY